MLEVVPAASDCECADGTRVLMAIQEARALDALDVHEAALRGVKEERSEGDGGGLRDLRLVSRIARKDEDPGRFLTQRRSSVLSMFITLGITRSEACHKAAFLGKELPCRIPSAIWCRWFRRACCTLLGMCYLT